MNTNSYHDTVNESQQLVIDFERKAKHQEDAVLQVFQLFRWNGSQASPSEIYDWVVNYGGIDKKTPLTSIRRAISNLTKRGLLRKTNIKVQGLYGRSENIWERVI